MGPVDLPVVAGHAGAAPRRRAARRRDPGCLPIGPTTRGSSTASAASPPTCGCQPHRPVQPALHLLHARRGPGLAADERAAHRRRDRPADHASRSSGSASRRSASPAGSRCCAAGSEDRARRDHALRTASGIAPQTALTTNALGLARRAGGAGRGRAGPGQRLAWTPSTAARFARITHRDRLPDVLAGHPAAAADAGLAPVKINTVLLRGVNDDEAVPLLRFALEHGYELRFIEQMPLDPQGAWSRDEMVTGGRDPGGAVGAVHPDPGRCRRTRARHRPRRGWSPTASGRDGSASSPPSPGRSAATATAPGSPRTVRCATACSPAARPTCAALLRAGAERRGDRGCLAWGHVGEAAGPRHRRSRLPAAGPADERDRGLKGGRAVQLTVRYFAGASAAAGLEEELVEVPDAATVEVLAGVLAERHGGGLARVLDVEFVPCGRGSGRPGAAPRGSAPRRRPATVRGRLTDASKARFH